MRIFFFAVFVAAFSSVSAAGLEQLRREDFPRSSPLSSDDNTNSFYLPLPPLNIDPNSITISGFDSGAIFANQMQIAHSARIRAACLVSGVPFMCSQGTLIGATACMQHPNAIVNQVLRTQTLMFEQLGYIDHTGNLERQYTLVFSAPKNSVVSHLATERMVQLLSALGAGRIETLYNYTEAGHAWITDREGNNECSYTGSPYINDCHVPLGNVFLKKALAFLHIPTTPLPSSTRKSNRTAAAQRKEEMVGEESPKSHSLPDLVTFSQAIFGANPEGNSMDEAGFAFIPSQCYRSIAAASATSMDNTRPRGPDDRLNTTLCRLHLHFHGCQQSRTSMGKAYAQRSGLNTQWAIDNDIVIVYPQAAPNALKYNPMGCWDWFNYNNENFYTNWGEFATKRGVQMRIVMHLLKSILSGT